MGVLGGQSAAPEAGKNGGGQRASFAARAGFAGCRRRSETAKTLVFQGLAHRHGACKTCWCSRPQPTCGLPGDAYAVCGPGGIGRGRSACRCCSPRRSRKAEPAWRRRRRSTWPISVRSKALRPSHNRRRRLAGPTACPAKRSINCCRRRASRPRSARSARCRCCSTCCNRARTAASQNPTSRQRPAKATARPRRSSTASIRTTTRRSMSRSCPPSSTAIGARLKPERRARSRALAMVA